MESRIIEKSFNVNGQLYDLILTKADSIFTIHVKDTDGRLHFHEQEIAEQMGVQMPGIDHLIAFISAYYTSGLNIRRSRDFQIKLLVEGCPQLFRMESFQVSA